MKHALILILALAGCVPHTVMTEHDRGQNTAPDTQVTTPATTPAKPPLPPAPLPPNVTREVLPDGSIRITIREPRCTTCKPWTY